MSLFLRILCLLLLPLPALGQTRITEVTWHTPNDWDGYVDKEGKGFYVDLMTSAFKERGITVKRETVPWKRALHNVLVGRADFTGGQSPVDRYYLSKLPVIQGWELVFAKKGTFPSSALDHLHDKKGVWPIGYIDGFPEAIKRKVHGKEVANREQAIRMVLSGRADYYLDNSRQMSDTIKAVGYPLSAYSCNELFSAKVYMVFTKNDRGRAVRDQFDEGIESLLRSGKLREIYEKWNFALPETN